MEKYYEIKINSLWKPAKAHITEDNIETFYYLKNEQKILLDEFEKREINIDSRYLKNLGFRYNKIRDCYLKEHIFIKQFKIIIEEPNMSNFYGYFISQVADCNYYVHLKQQLKKTNDLNILIDKLILIKTTNQLFEVLKKDDYRLSFNAEEIMRKSYYAI